MTTGLRIGENMETKKIKIIIGSEPQETTAKVRQFKETHKVVKCNKMSDTSYLVFYLVDEPDMEPTQESMPFD